MFCFGGELMKKNLKKLFLEEDKNIYYLLQEEVQF